MATPAPASSITSRITSQTTSPLIAPSAMPDADFAGAQRDDERHYALEPNRGQHRRQHSERAR